MESQLDTQLPEINSSKDFSTQKTQKDLLNQSDFIKNILSYFPLFCNKKSNKIEFNIDICR